MSTTPSSAKRSARLGEILQILGNHGLVSHHDLAQRLGTSEATIRRDVASLAADGLVIRTHGGARLAGSGEELPFHLRDTCNHVAKQRIAATAASLIPAGQHAIGMTGGTTTAEVLRALHHRDDLTIITNSLSIGLEAAEQGQSRVLIAGGVLRRNSLELVGQLAESILKVVRIETAFIGVDGISADGGLTTHDEIEARTNHALIERSERVVVVADASKIGTLTDARMAAITDVAVLVTDATAPADELQRIRATGVDVRVVPVSAA